MRALAWLVLVCGLLVGCGSEFEGSPIALTAPTPIAATAPAAPATTQESMDLSEPPTESPFGGSPQDPMSLK